MGKRSSGIANVVFSASELDKSSRRKIKPIHGSEFTLDCDSIILAIGHLGFTDGQILAAIEALGQ